MVEANTANGWVEGLKVGRGCEYGHLTEVKLDNAISRIDKLEKTLSDIEFKLDVHTYMLIALSLLVGADVVLKLVPLLLR